MAAADDDLAAGWPASGDAVPAKTPPVGPADLQCLGIASVWAVPPADGVQGSVSFEMLGGPKRYARVWWTDREPFGEVEWGWTLHDSAVQLWPAP